MYLTGHYCLSSSLKAPTYLGTYGIQLSDLVFQFIVKYLSILPKSGDSPHIDSFVWNHEGCSQSRVPIDLCAPLIISHLEPGYSISTSIELGVKHQQQQNIH